MKSVKHGSLISSQNLVILAFIIVSLLSALTPHFKLDILISEKIQSINSIVFSNIMWLVSSIGNQPFMAAIIIFTCLLLYLFKLRVEAIVCSLASASSALSGSLLKLLVDHPRPEASQVRVSVFLSDKSYPSNHVLVFTVFFGFLLYLLFKRTNHKGRGVLPAILFFILIATVGISRIYLGVHWASDVLGGYLLGIIWLTFTIRIYNFYHGKR